MQGSFTTPYDLFLHQGLWGFPGAHQVKLRSVYDNPVTWSQQIRVGRQSNIGACMLSSFFVFSIPEYSMVRGCSKPQTT